MTGNVWFLHQSHPTLASAFLRFPPHIWDLFLFYGQSMLIFTRCSPALEIFNEREANCTNDSASRHLTTATKVLEKNKILPWICDDFWVSGFVIGKQKFGEENLYKVKPKAFTTWRVEREKKFQFVFLVMKPRKLFFRQIYFGCSVSVKAHGDDVGSSIKCSELLHKEGK